MVSTHKKETPNEKNKMKLKSSTTKLYQSTSSFMSSKQIWNLKRHQASDLGLAYNQLEATPIKDKEND